MTDMILHTFANNLIKLGVRRDLYIDITRRDTALIHAFRLAVERDALNSCDIEIIYDRAGRDVINVIRAYAAATGGLNSHDLLLLHRHAPSWRIRLQLWWYFSRWSRRLR